MSDAAVVLHEPWEEPDRQREGVLFGMWLFLASELMLFGGLFLAYAACRWNDTAGFEAAAAHTNLSFGALNTVLLMTSSAAAAVAARAAGARLTRLATLAIGVTIALGLGFLAVKALEYRQDLHEHLWPGPAFAIPTRGGRLFFSLYWLITGVHVAHLLIGLSLFARLAIMAGRGTLARNADSVEVTALYWGLVDVIWILLFPLLYLAGR